MELLLELTLLALSAVVLVPATVLCAEIAFSGRGYAAARAVVPECEHLRVAVLVPAHNEANGIGTTVRCLQEQLRPGDRLLVIADNCDDDTAELARAAGADVAVRNDPSRRGKGFALAHGLGVLGAAPPDVVVMVDADCTLMPRAARTLAGTAWAVGRPVQACYLMLPQDPESLAQRVAVFAWRVQNLLRPLGAASLGFPCLLTGSGMAFRWVDLQGVPLASGNIVEDLQLGLDLCRLGRFPRFCVDAMVTSDMAPSDHARASQRRRWEHGYLATMVRGVPRLLGEGLRRRDLKLTGIALTLSVPPIALLVLACILLGIVTAARWASGGGVAPAILSTLALGLVLIAAAGAWLKAGRDLIPPKDLWRLPIYVLQKIPLYLGFFHRRETSWVRTDRE